MTPDLDPHLRRWLPAFLIGQRWFGAKNRTIVSCDVEDVATLGRAADASLVICRVQYTDAPPERYLMLLARRGEDAGLPRLGRLDPSAAGSIVEAASEPRAVLALLDGFAGASVLTTRRGGRLEYADIGRTVAETLAVAPTVALVGAEQSNTSIRIGRDFMFKLVRRLEPGENPDLEIARFLSTRTTFRGFPRLAGSITYRPPVGEAMTVALLQEWIESRGDGWGFVLAALAQARASGSNGAELQADMRQLGACTAEFHAALASDPDSDAFRPEPITPGDVAGWLADLRAQAARDLNLVRSNQAGWTGPTRALGDAAADALSRIPEVVESLRASLTPTFSRIRVHGDFHLGQTLKTPSDFVLIDFEGEPARPLPFRRQKHCGFKDVAGMLRSFAYALLTEAGADPEEPNRNPLSIDLRTPFLAGYFESSARLASVSTPRDPGAALPWLRLFELEKVCYELEYEINNRPSWVVIPLKGLVEAGSSPLASDL